MGPVPTSIIPPGTWIGGPPPAPTSNFLSSLHGNGGNSESWNSLNQFISNFGKHPPAPQYEDVRSRTDQHQHESQNITQEIQRLNSLSQSLPQQQSQSTRSQTNREAMNFISAPIEDKIRSVFNKISARRALENQPQTQNSFQPVSQQLLLEIQAIHQDIRDRSHEVMNQLSHPRVTALLEQQASDFIREQIQTSELIIQRAERLAPHADELSSGTIRMIAQFAKDLVDSSGEFLTGIQQGFYDSFNHASIILIDAARAIYQNPTLLGHLAQNAANLWGNFVNSAMQTITDPTQLINSWGDQVNWVFNTFTSDQFPRQVSETLSDIKDKVIEGSRRIVADGSFRLGQNIGRAGGDTLIFAAALEGAGVNHILQGPERLRIPTAEPEVILPENPVSIPPEENIPQARVPRLGNQAQAGIGVLDSATLGTRHGPLNPGRLHSISANPEISIAQGGPSIADTFRNSSYTAYPLSEPKRYFRVQNFPPNNDYPLSSYWTEVGPSGPVQSIIDSALDQGWRQPNRAMEWIEIEAPTGTLVNVGAAADQRGLVGGGNQIYIEGEISHAWIRNRGRFPNRPNGGGPVNE